MFKTITFSQSDNTIQKTNVVEFASDTGKNYEITARIFSTSKNNRNKIWFEITDLLEKSGNPGSVLNDLDHNLALSGGRYFGINKTKTKKIWGKINGAELEIWATMETSDETFVSYIDKITQPSIELKIDTDRAIITDKGEYYPRGSTEFYAIGWLLGQPAGQGDTEITEIKEFSEVDKKDEIVEEEDTMTEEQQKQFKAEMLDEIKAELSKFSEDLLAKVKKFNEEQKEPEPTLEPVEETTPPADELSEKEKEVEMALNNASKIAMKTAEFKGSEKVSAFGEEKSAQKLSLSNIIDPFKNL